ncbi:sigma-70 family RNA polymerase sigma factor [bacterium]|jgi:RNA polymerase sigma factor (sigma-70 family)|nr:sigma-70 family RNA polymerase sigma factor [bacterium]
MGQYYSKLYPQSIFRRSRNDDSGDRVELKTTLPDISSKSAAVLFYILSQTQDMCDVVFVAILPESHIDKQAHCLSVVSKALGVAETKKLKPGKGSKTAETLWIKLQSNILNTIKLEILKRYTDVILEFFAQKLNYLVKQYARHLPHHIANSEGDDLSTIAQLELLETFKSWNPQKNTAIWPLAYSRINGAMKDHIRYISKSDPGRFYDWVTDAAYVFMSYNTTTMEDEIETDVQLTEAMEILTPREKRIVVAYVKDDQTFQHISKQIKISESQISRIYKKSIEKIQKHLDKKSKATGC